MGHGGEELGLGLIGGFGTLFRTPCQADLTGQVYPPDQRDRGCQAQCARHPQ